MWVWIRLYSARTTIIFITSVEAGDSNFVMGAGYRLQLLSTWSAVIFLAAEHRRPQPVLDYTTFCQTHTCVDNLLKAVIWQWSGCWMYLSRIVRAKCAHSPISNLRGLKLHVPTSLPSSDALQTILCTVHRLIISHYATKSKQMTSNAVITIVIRLRYD